MLALTLRSYEPVHIGESVLRIARHGLTPILCARLSAAQGVAVSVNDILLKQAQDQPIEVCVSFAPTSIFRIGKAVIRFETKGTGCRLLIEAPAEVLVLRAKAFTQFPSVLKSVTQEVK